MAVNGNKQSVTLRPRNRKSTTLHSCVHSLTAPRLGDWDICELHARIVTVWVVDPFRRVSNLDGHILQRDREMDQVQVHIVQLEILQRLPTSKLDVLCSVEGVPQLGSDPQFLRAFSRAVAIAAKTK